MEIVQQNSPIKSMSFHYSFNIEHKRSIVYLFIDKILKANNATKTSPLFSIKFLFYTNFKSHKFVRTSHVKVPLIVFLWQSSVIYNASLTSLPIHFKKIPSKSSTSSNVTAQFIYKLRPCVVYNVITVLLHPTWNSSVLAIFFLQ